MKRHLLVFALVGAIVTSGVLIGVSVGGSAPAAKIQHASTKNLPAVFDGLSGKEASWVVAENDKAGTRTWQINNAPKNNAIAGYANVTYAAQGQSVALYVSTKAASFHIDAYRMGYYHDAGARLVWSSPQLHGAVQPACRVTPGVNMVACDTWHVSTTLRVTSAFVQGDYLLKLVGSGHQQSYVPLTVWDPSSTATYVIKNDVFTWQAWNDYGGFDFYDGHGSCAPTYPICSRARIVSFDRPYDYGEGAADFLSEEYPLVAYAEKRGLDVTYVNDIAIEQHPNVLVGHRVLMSLGHDECWSLPERQAAVRAEQGGMNMVFFGASAMLRHVRMQASPLGSDREEVDYRNSAEDPLNGHAPGLLVTGNTWSSAPANWPESPFVGESYAGYLEPNSKHAALVISKASAWVFRGTHLRNGGVVPGVIASDFDAVESGQPHPKNVEILTHSPVSLAATGAERRGVVYADMTYYSDPKSHAGIFDSGTNNWIPALSPCAIGTRCSAHDVELITGNVLRAFGYGPAGLVQDSTATPPPPRKSHVRDHSTPTR